MSHLRRKPVQRRSRERVDRILDAAAEIVATLELMIFVVWEACQALLETAFRSDPDGDPAVIAQTTVLAHRYLQPAFEA